MKKLFSSPRFLAIYSGVLTVAFAAVVLLGLAPARKAAFDVIDVQRINVVEPDGTPRLVISNAALCPGIYIKKVEHPHPNRKTAGLIFINDEGTENGGLTFGGRTDEKGVPTSFGHLSFDAYMQDQVLVLDSGQEGSASGAGLSLVDRPSYPITEDMAMLDRVKNLPEEKRKAEMEAYFKSHPAPKRRLSLARADDGSVGLKMRDPEGRDRIVMQVKPDGTPVLRFLDASGKVTAEMTPSQK